MPVDDTDDKVRRNLVVFSALIVASAWLGHPELWLVTKLLAPEAAPPSAWKVTSLALSVLIYLAGRYWFSPAHSDARSILGKDLYRAQTKICDYLIKQKVQNYQRTKKQPTFIITDLDDLLNGPPRAFSGNTTEELEVHLEVVRIQPRREWEGEVFILCRLHDRTPPKLLSGEIPLAYNFPVRLQRKIKFQAVLKQVLYSRTTFEYFTPLFLSTAAMVILLVRLYNSILPTVVGSA